MSSGSGANARSLARTILALVAASLVSLLLFATGPLGPVSLAQEPTASPTPSATGSTAYQINFLSPSGYSSSGEEEISSKDDFSEGDTQNTFHLVAWVNQVPPDVQVEFSFRPPGDNKDAVITSAAEQTDVPDTFEFDWDPPQSSFDGPITLKARLLSGSTPVAEDVETDVTLNDRDREDQSPTAPENQTQAEDRGETIELQYPVNGGTWGLSKPRDQSAGGLIDITFSDGVALGYMTLFYSISPPGSEPEWIECAFDFLPLPRYPCPLRSSDDPEDVTAVAALANDTPPDPFVGFTWDPAFDDAGDAHRVAPYFQAAEKVDAVPETQTDVAKSKCATKFTVTVTDQEDRPIHRANLDVHAQGPNDDVSFDDSDNDPGDPQGPTATNVTHKAPDVGGHRTEEAVDCEALSAPAPPPPPEPPFTGFQGDHDDPVGLDVKHIESLSGTSVNGTWAFGIYSFVEGTTQLTVWSDEDNDDQRCTEEASDDLSIGWRDPAPSATGVPATVTDCPITHPTQGSPSPQPTETIEPSPEPTGDPRNCTIVGDESDNTLNGTSGDDVICAYGGNDIIRGLGGKDLIYGDAGSDEIRGGGGNDATQGGDGKDVIRGAGGNDFIDGGNQNDTLLGGGGRDGLSGGPGFDILRGGDGRDSLKGGTGDDVLKGALANDSLEGGGGRDILTGDKGRDRCRGGPGKDRQRSCET